MDRKTKQSQVRAESGLATPPVPSCFKLRPQRNFTSLGCRKRASTRYDRRTSCFKGNTAGAVLRCPTGFFLEMRTAARMCKSMIECTVQASARSRSCSWRVGLLCGLRTSDIYMYVLCRKIYVSVRNPGSKSEVFPASSSRRR